MSSEMFFIMANYKFSSLMFLLPLFFAIFPALVLSDNPLGAGRCANYDAVFSFGDSLTDNGNALFLNPANGVGRPPYGQSFFNRPTGRFSDGRIIIDFIAQGLGLPLAPAYYPNKGNASLLKNGADFAVAAAAVLNNSFYAKNGIGTGADYSLGVQLQSFQQLLPSLFPKPADQKRFVSRSVFMLGEIGGNDYGRFVFNGKTVDQAKAIAPQVVDTMASAINTLIGLGALTIVVPTPMPMGCSPAYHGQFANRPKTELDQYGCFKWANDMMENHNTVLRNKLQQLQTANPKVKLIYADYYSAVLNLVRFPKQNGMNNDTTTQCCAGCGSASGKSCAEPGKAVWWDSWHLTEAAANFVAKGVLQGPYGSPTLLSTCTSSTSATVAGQFALGLNNEFHKEIISAPGGSFADA